jgi:hypothetical protein
MLNPTRHHGELHKIKNLQKYTHPAALRLDQLILLRLQTRHYGELRKINTLRTKKPVLPGLVIG